ncbi:alpha/beta fold hydrolase [Nocardia spumae]|uniref:alpha/beta fold hydrolase n=1 Tax=Nocardia spumae TaxID=2887190 RepID=UPI001D14DFA4|nr:alpha/beta hydrolase [Nocardia spumae]
MTNNSTSAARLDPPVAGFQDIDGRRIFVHRAGSGGPAVVFLPGAGAVGLDYFTVQQGVSEFTTAVVYDRGGTGYSDPVPLPRTAAAVATELRDVLRAEGLAGPYVLAPHSLGGLYAHRFAQLYPREVAGLVWLDGLHRDWDSFMPSAASLAATERMTPDPDRLRELRAAVRAMSTELYARYPEHIRQPLIDAKAGDDWLRAGLAERRALVELATELRSGPDIPDVPVVALTVLGEDPDGNRISREIQEGRRAMDAALAGSVSCGQQRIVSGTVHHRLCFDRPDAVIRAIRDVLDRAASV